MAEEVVFTKTLSKSGKGFLAWVPKDIASHENLSAESTVECRIINLSSKDRQELVFTKRLAKSGRALLLWVPKDVTDFLVINVNSLCQLKLRKLVRP
jgi:hypothetical protein